MADIAIFRINYKSDFILTLNSDAGWLTPFCIKFWTGSPLQAYYAGYDGTTYTHCAPVDGEPTKLRVQFDDHHLPIGNLQFQIAYHFTVDDFPTSVEDEVLNQASVIIEVDDQPAQVMLDLNGETAPEIQFTLPAYTNEQQRIANEEQRIAHEAIRIVNEESRIAAETIRQQNEAQRISNEESRVTEFDRLKSESEAATIDANAAATLANAKAQLAADKAALADAAATLANDKAALAQKKAEYAQTQGDYAKEQGEIAEEDHSRAESDHGIAVDDHTQAGNDHTRAESDHGIAADDHTRAESDHGIAADDHTQAGNDHTRAESDHGIAVDDHTQAGNDHTRAESDHGIAADDHTRAESDHGIAVDDHTQAGNDHTRAESDHTRAESDHAAVEVYIDSLGVFDLSKHNAVGGVMATYADLSAALTALNALESKYKYGGMSFKFVQSSDNKYVQYRYMLTDVSTAATFTDVANWQGVTSEVKAGSKDLVESGGVHENIKEIIGYDGKLIPIATIYYRLQNSNSSNYGYWYSNTQRSLVFDLSTCKGKTIKLNTYSIYNTYNYCIVSDYLSIPSSYEPETFDPLVLLSGGKTSDDNVLKTYDVNVPETNTECYLIVSCSASHVNDVNVVCQANAIEPLSDFKEAVNTFMLEHEDDIKKEDISLTGTNYLGVMPAQTHRIASATIGSELEFGGSSGYQSSHEYLPVQEGEIYYLMYGYANVIHAAVTDDNNIVVAAYTDSIYYAGLLRVEIPQGGKFLTWTTSEGGTLGWYVKVADKKYDNYLLYGGEVKHYVPSEIQTVSTDVVCTQSKHLVNGINMIDCEMNGTTSKIVIPIDYTKECKKGFYLRIDSSQIDKITGVAVNGNNLDVYSTFSYQDCFYLSCPIAASTSTIEITVTLAEGVTDDVTVAISSQMDVNRINKAVLCVNFDHSWQASVDCGAYDYIFGIAKFPVTITGTVDMSIYDFKSLLANGMLEIGTYGGNQGFEQQCSNITEGCSMAVLNQHLDVKEDYYQDDFKIQPHTFGGRQHNIDRKIIFALKKNGYHSSRMRNYDIFGGANYGGVVINGFNIVSRIHESSSNGGVGDAIKYQAAINFFAHGLSTDGSGSLETKWSTFKEKIDYAKQNVDNGAMMAMTFEQYYQTLKRFGLVANVC